MYSEYWPQVQNNANVALCLVDVGISNFLLPCSPYQLSKMRICQHRVYSFFPLSPSGNKKSVNPALNNCSFMTFTSCTMIRPCCVTQYSCDSPTTSLKVTKPTDSRYTQIYRIHKQLPLYIYTNTWNCSILCIVYNVKYAISLTWFTYFSSLHTISTVTGQVTMQHAVATCWSLEDETSSVFVDPPDLCCQYQAQKISLIQEKHQNVISFVDCYRIIFHTIFLTDVFMGARALRELYLYLLS